VCKELDDTKQIAELLKAEVEQLKVRVERCSLWIVPAAHSLFLFLFRRPGAKRQFREPISGQGTGNRRHEEGSRPDESDGGKVGTPSVLFFGRSFVRSFVRLFHSFGSWRDLTPGHTLVSLCCSARRFQQEMTKNAGLINNLNMEQERLLEMLSKVKETHFKRVPFHSHHTTALIPRD
jgi:hypothetical protein